MFSRHRIDATPADALFALRAGLLHRSGPPEELRGAVLALSVRSAFELLLRSAQWNSGDEVIMTAVTHPDMARIVHLNGLVVVVVDIDPESLAPTREALENARTNRTRAVVVAHLFGSRSNLDETVAFARRNQLLLVEDCAQALRSASDSGDQRADVSLFSFGFIKTATAFGGALAYVRNADLRNAMLERQRTWPVQSRMQYAMKSLKCLLALVASRPGIYGLCLHSGRDFSAMARTIPPGDDVAFLKWLCRRPSGGLAATLERRLNHFPTTRMKERRIAAADFIAALPRGLRHPGETNAGSTHWLVPVITPEPQELIRVLCNAGFEATQGTSQIASLCSSATKASRMMRSIVFVPVYPELSRRDRTRLAAIMQSADVIDITRAANWAELKEIQPDPIA